MLKPRRAQGTALFVGLLALLVGVFHSGRYSLWNDEGFSVATAHLHIGKLLTFTRERDPHTGFYHLLLHYWIAINGDGEMWIRFLSAIFAAGAAIFLLLMLRRLFDELTAVLAALLFVGNGFFVAYAQEARPYALALLLTCVAMYLFVVAVQTQRFTAWLGWSVVAVTAIYAHPFAAIPVVAAHASLFVAPKRPRLKTWLLTTVIQVAGATPLVWMLSTQKMEHIDWIPSVTPSILLSGANSLTGHGGAAMTLLVGVLVAWLVVRTVSSLRRKDERTNAWGNVLILLWALGVPAVLLGASVIKHVFLSRYLIPALPGMMAAAVVSVRAIKAREYKGIAAVALVILTVASLHNWFANSPKDNWRDAAKYVAQNAQAGDGIVVSYDQRNVFQYYFMRDGAKKNSAPIPISPLRPWGSNIPVRETRIDASSPTSVAKSVALYQRVWVLYLSTEPAQKNLDAGLSEVFDSTHDEFFKPRVMATLYQNAANAQ